MIDISGLDKVELLRKLWENQIVSQYYSDTGRSAPEFDIDEARSAVQDDIDYFCGRCIKCDISGDEADPTDYDIDAGKGIFLKIVGEMKSK